MALAPLPKGFTAELKQYKRGKYPVYIIDHPSLRKPQTKKSFDQLQTFFRTNGKSE